MTFLRKTLACTAIACAFSGVAQADTLYQDALAQPPISATITDGTNTHERAGLGSLALYDTASNPTSTNPGDWTRFVAYCFQPFQDISSNMTVLPFVPLGTGTTYAKSAYTNADINDLFDLYYKDTIQGPTFSQTVADNAAAFQLALWNLEGNALTVSNLQGTTADVVSKAASYVTGATGALVGTQHYNLTLWADNSTSQDFISAKAVPEPASLALLGLGLAGLLSSRRRAV